MNDMAENHYLTLEICGRSFALPIEAIERVIPVSEQTVYTILHGMPSYTICVAELQGQPVAVIDLPELLLHAGATRREFPLVILVKQKRKYVGFAADGVAIIASSVSDMEKSSHLILNVDEMLHWLP